MKHIVLSQKWGKWEVRSYFFLLARLLRSLDIYGIAEFIYLLVLQDGTLIGCLLLVSYPVVFISSKKPLCLSLLNVSSANFRVRVSLHAERVGNLRRTRASSYGTTLSLTL